MVRYDLCFNCNTVPHTRGSLLCIACTTYKIELRRSTMHMKRLFDRVNKKDKKYKNELETTIKQLETIYNIIVERENKIRKDLV